MRPFRMPDYWGLMPKIKKPLNWRQQCLYEGRREEMESGTRGETEGVREETKSVKRGVERSGEGMILFYLVALHSKRILKLESSIMVCEWNDGGWTG